MTIESKAEKDLAMKNKIKVKEEKQKMCIALLIRVEQNEA